MRKFIFYCLFGLFPVLGFSQGPDSLRNWKTGGTATLNFSQSSLTNWAAGGENAFSTTALMNLYANYKKNKISWENTLDATYGMLQSGNTDLRKSDDKFDITSKLGNKLTDHWSAAVMMNLKSQFTHGYNYPNDSVVISDFMAPAYLLLATGMDYKPADFISVLISPVTGKMTIVNDQRLANLGSYGVKAATYDSTGTILSEGEKLRYEFGALVSIKIKKDIAKNINLSTKADFFSNYMKDPQNMDVNWDLLLTMKVNKFISASISTSLIYDHDVPIPVFENIGGIKTQVGTGPRTQFKEVLAIGFSYKF